MKRVLLISLIAAFRSIGSAQAVGPAIPQMEIFWISKVPTDSTVTLKISWYPLAPADTVPLSALDTIEVQLVEYTPSGVMISAQGFKQQGDTAAKTTMTCGGFRQTTIVFLRWRAYGEDGDSGWSDVKWFATADLVPTPVLLYPPNNAVNVKE